MPAPVFLLTDFGLADGYVGAMRAVLARLAPDAPVHDVTHAVPPQDVLAARLQLAAILPYLPDAAVVCTVVDPGVGTDRRAVVLEAVHPDGRRLSLVAPDNGLATSLLDGDREPYASGFRVRGAWELGDDPGGLAGPGRTFDGRDLFAPAAARRARGEPPDNFASRLDPADLVRRPAPSLTTLGTGVRGRVAWIDRFGDLVSDVPASRIAPCDPSDVEVRVAGSIVRGLKRAFADVPVGRPLAYPGSLGTVEVAVRDGSAARELDVGVGDAVEVHVRPNARAF